MLTDTDRALLGNTTLVLVADSVVLESGDMHWLSRRLDQTELRHVDELAVAIKPLLKNLVVYKTPRDFIDKISDHRNDIILPDWGGAESWSRCGLVPAICEAYGISYIGGDAYTKIVCQDKFLTKSICRHVGLDAPRAIYVDKISKLDSLETLDFPCVVKPCFEGSSIGIDENSLVATPREARERAIQLLRLLASPVLVERFCPGREISLCLLGNDRGISLAEAGERYLPDDEAFFDSNLFSFDLKKNSKRTALRLVTPTLPVIVLQRAQSLFRLLKKVEVIRVDGRLDGDRFNVIELTPDTHLGARAEYAGTFILAGMTYTEVLAKIILNSLDISTSRSANTRTWADNSRNAS